MALAEENRLGTILMREGLLSQEQLEFALARQVETRRLLGTILVELDMVTEHDIRRALAAQLAIPSLDLSQIEIAPEVASLLPPEFCRLHRVAPVFAEDSTVTVAMADPGNVRALDLVRASLPGRRVNPVVASESDILHVIDRGRAEVVGLEDPLRLDLEELQSALSDRADMRLSPFEMPDIVRLRCVASVVERLLEQAHHLHATRLFIDPGRGRSTVRLVVDGGSRDVAELPGWAHPVICGRLKWMAGLDLTNVAGVQEGVLSDFAVPQGMEVRVTVLPTVDGDRLAARLIPTDAAPLRVAHLGMTRETQSLFLSLLSAPRGLLLVAGPPHSGVTTTLYSAAAELARMGRVTVSLEQRAERYLPGVFQVPLAQAGSEAFAATLRAVRRQDVKAVAVGEMLDRPAAQEACEAALDCLVLVAVRADDAPAALRFLLNLGLDRYVLSACLLGAIGQRLVRLNCPDCAQPVEGHPALRAALQHVAPLPEEAPSFKAGRGCPVCGQSGLARAIPVFELLPAAPALQSVLLAGVSVDDLRQTAAQVGMRPVADQVLAHAWAGSVPPLEALRVCLPERHAAEGFRAAG